MKTFLISDTHFGHVNILKFQKKDGSQLRVFDSIQEHDEALIENWNSVVKNGDKVYHLGDVSMCNWTRTSEILGRLNGDKVLIKGNHDGAKMNQYLQFFKDVRAYHQLDKFILSHIPIHPLSLSRWKANVHGHLHANAYDDPRYLNVSVERINFTPINFEEVREIIYENIDNP